MTDPIIPEHTTMDINTHQQNMQLVPKGMWQFLTVPMEDEWVMLNCQMLNSNSTDACNFILLPGVVDCNRLQIHL